MVAGLPSEDMIRPAKACPNTPRDMQFQLLFASNFA